ncbi:3D-(3,5/4)-trihydroxycyclohexane-1,2-dione acylhydrolase (decyclizing) [Nocardioides sp.]|uniref:3D-(3,5/4)-trihydroxycyclohexane-1,2-dione acylhydrolase (decyclizing) n=1 Tax=Nocardioides sp. TaxID=35761 RepID=UPI0035B4D526
MTQTVRLTTAQALVRWMLAQRSELLDGTEVPLFPGVFAIFGHGNVLGLGTALYDVRDELPTWRAQNEQGMALAAVAYARAVDRRQVMVATTSVGPGALNMVTAAGLAHANRLPVLLLPGDTFTSRAPDPVLQQVEHFGDPTISVNDAFRPVARYFDRITRPEQLISTLPQVARVLTDPADCGPAVLALPQDVQAEEFDFPAAMFKTTLHRVPRTRPDTVDLDRAAQVLQAAERPLLVLGGGVRYSGAAAEALALAEAHRVPIVETVAGRTLVPHDHPLFGGALGIIGSTSANTLAAQADVIVAVGTRLQDFTTSSWTGFHEAVQIVTINAARFDAVKHGALAVVGDARATLTELDSALNAWTSPTAWADLVPDLKGSWDDHVDALRAGDGQPESLLTYAQVTGVVNDVSTPDDYVLTASGGMPGELHGGWRTGEVKHGLGATSGATMDLEYGFSCMGYEVVAPWGAAMARERTHPEGLVTSIFGDGSYLMLNSEIYSAAFAGHPYVAVLCDNGGFAVIHRLQTNQGADGFNNLLADSRGPGADGSVHVDFAAHAASLGAHVEDVRDSSDVAALRAAYVRAREAARSQRRPAVVVCNVQQSSWTEAGAWWETGTPKSLSGRTTLDEAKTRQLRWLS